MDEEVFNLETRKFLKTFGVSAQREIERAVREALAQGILDGNETLRVHARLDIDGLKSSLTIDGEIALR